MADIGPSNPLYDVFRDLVDTALVRELGPPVDAEVGGYLAMLLVDFAHADRIFAVRDASGRRLRSVSEMLPEANVLESADSFERERAVHKHIGDFILFWSGVYPEFLRRLRVEFLPDLAVNYSRQGQASYHVVSTFDYSPHAEEAPKFRRLSEGFETYAYCLRTIRDELPIEPA